MATASEGEIALIRDYGDATTFLRGTGCLLLRAGLILIQFGSIPFTNANGVIFQNIIDLSCATLLYGTIGFMFSFGNDKGGLIGWGGRISIEATDLDNAVLGWSFVVVATGITTTMCVGRLHYFGGLLITTVFAGLIIPVLIHWIWTSKGWLNKATLIQNDVSFKDHGGGMLIHVCGAGIGTIGSFILGRRVLRLQDIDESSFTPESPISASVGYIFVIIGLIGVCLPTPSYEVHHEPLNYIGFVFINNILAAAGGISIVALLQFILFRHIFFQYWSVLKYMQGAVAGIVIIASGVDVYTPYVCLGLGAFGGIVFYIISYYMFYTALEDYANVFAIHLICGFLSTLLPPLCGSREGFGVPSKILLHLLWQFIADIIILLLIFTFALCILYILKMLKILGNKKENENHKRASILLRTNQKNLVFQRLWQLSPESQLFTPGCRTNKEFYQQNLNTSEIEDITVPSQVASPRELQRGPGYSAYPVQTYTINNEYRLYENLSKNRENPTLSKKEKHSSFETRNVKNKVSVFVSGEDKNTHLARNHV